MSRRWERKNSKIAKNIEDNFVQLQDDVLWGYIFPDLNECYEKKLIT